MPRFQAVDLQDSGSIALRMAPAQDVMMGLLAAAGLAVCVVATATAANRPLTLAVFLAAAAFLICVLAGCLWRGLDPRPALLADGSGLRFHPSLCHRQATWREVRRIRIVSGGRPPASGELQFDLTFQPLAPSTFPLRRTVCLRLISLGPMSWREARALRKQMLALKRHASKSRE